MSDKPLFFSNRDCDACQFAISEMKKKGVWKQVKEVKVNKQSGKNWDLSEKYKVDALPTLVDPKSGKHLSVEKLLKKIGSL